MTDREDDADPRFEATTDPTGVRIVDPIEAVDFVIGTDQPVTPAPIETDSFHFPIDAAVAFETSEIEFPHWTIFTVRDEEGTHICDLVSEGTRRFSGGRYTVELGKTPVKIYLAIEGAFTTHVSGDSPVIQLEGRGRVSIGARSYHTSPAGTITTTTDPDDIASVLSQFGSALKTRSPERSWPTLRGHPPLLDRGDELRVPDALSSTESGVIIVVPPRLDALFPVASLAFYLDATVRLGPEARLCADGQDWSLTRDGDIETTAANVLRRQFSLDCVVRMAGYYDIDLYEGRLVVDDLPFGPAEVYDWSLPARVATYMDAPRDAVDAASPRWRLTADVVPDRDSVGALPHLAHELATIRCPVPDDLDDPGVGGARRPVFERDRPDPATLTRSAEAEWDQNFVFPDETTSVEHVYCGPGVPVGASEVSVSAFERQLRRDPAEDVETEITVVVNDSEMVEGDSVADIYALDDLSSFDVTVLTELSRAEFRDALASGTDLLHYIGHVADRGLECTDGFLDAESVESVDVEAFFLNACTSYRQGRALVATGAAGGIVTVEDVFDSLAARVGTTVARLLGHGFSLEAALGLCKRTTDFPTGEYTIVGDGGLRVTQNETGVPTVYHLAWDDGLTVTPVAFPVRGVGLGSTVVPFRAGNDRHFLAAGEGFPIETSVDAFVAGTESEPPPILVDGDLYWTSDLTGADIEELVGADRTDD